jgi:condensin complex subunit 2
VDVAVAQALEVAARAAQVTEMYKNCIKLAAENKISQKNTWSLNLIDHMSDLVKPSDEGRTTNFQNASCTLDAGIKIYAYRVDSVHSEAFKVLGGLSRSAGAAADDADGTADNGEPFALISRSW